MTRRAHAPIIALAVLGALACVPRPAGPASPHDTTRRDDHRAVAIGAAGLAPGDRKSHEARIERLVSAIDPARLRRTIEHLAQHPRLSGAPGQQEAAEWARDQLAGAGWDSDLWTTPAILPELVSARLALIESGRRQDLTPGEQPLADLTALAWDEVVPGFMAFSPAGRTAGDLVFAHDGADADYATLHELGVRVAGRIVLVRAGTAPARVLAETAARHLATGLLLAPAAPPEGELVTAPYPDGPGRAADAVTRGTLMAAETLTMRIHPARRLPRSRAGHPEPGAAVPIPVLPIDARTTTTLLAALAVTPAPDGWGPTADAPASPLFVGPGPAQVEMEIETRSARRSLTSVIARIEGSDEPLQEIVLGARLDAWTFGAGEDASGAAALIETARALGRLVASGWRPRRTLVLALWDGGAWGRLGARAWLAARERRLTPPPIAYVDAAPALAGPDLEVAAGPLLRRLAASLTGSSGKIDGPGRLTLLASPAGVSDGGAFLSAAVPVIEIHSRAAIMAAASGTAHDTFDRLIRFTDPDLAGARQGTAALVALALDLSDAPLPVADHGALSLQLLRALDTVDQAAHAAFDNNPPPVRAARLALSDYRLAAEAWDRARNTWLAETPVVPRGVVADGGDRDDDPAASPPAKPDRRSDGTQARLARANRAVAGALQPFHALAERTPVSSCGSLLFCVDPSLERAGALLFRARAAVAARDRSALVNEVLRLASAARAAAARLRAAAQALAGPTSGDDDLAARAD
ncbi:MAG: M28 family peptidase [Acidobacteriota bacterium]